MEIEPLPGGYLSSHELRAALAEFRLNDIRVLVNDQPRPIVAVRYCPGSDMLVVDLAELPDAVG